MTASKDAIAFFAETPGEGVRKLADVLLLADYDDEVADRLADAGTILHRAKQVMKARTQGETDAELTDEDRAVLSKAVKLRTLLFDEAELEVLRTLATQSAAAEAGTEELRELLFDTLELFLRSAQDFAAMLARVKELGFDLEIDDGILEAMDELVRRVDVLRPADDL